MGGAHRDFNLRDVGLLMKAGQGLSGPTELLGGSEIASLNRRLADGM